MAKRGTWAAGIVELRTAEGVALAALVVDEKGGKVVAHATERKESATEVEVLVRAITSAAEQGKPRAIAIAGELGRAVKDANVGIEILSRGSPVLARAIAALRSAAEAQGESALLAAGEEFVAASPWEVFDRTSGFVVESAELGIRDAIVFAMGPDGPEEVGGWFYVASEQDFALVAGHDRKGPLRADTLALHFDRSELGWIPVLDRTTREGGLVEESETDVELAAVISSALADMANARRKDEEGPWEVEIKAASGATVNVRGPLADAEDEDEADDGDPEEPSSP